MVEEKKPDEDSEKSLPEMGDFFPSPTLGVIKPLISLPRVL